MSRLEVNKTYKIFINGEFPRTESGRYYPIRDKKGKLLANLCLSSRKDFRNAVVACRGAFNGWFQRSAFNRSQILYRMAEMLEGRKEQLQQEMVLLGFTKNHAQEEIRRSVDSLVYYAGWCDKFMQVHSTVNPVASSHYNFSVPEPMGVIGVICPEESPLLGLIASVAPVIAGGNTCVALASESLGLCAITFAEVMATSDLPPGVVNILTGKTEELLEHFSAHMDVNALVYARKNKQEYKIIQENAVTNVKRTFWWDFPFRQAPDYIMDLQEIKTTWHPIEQIGGASAKY